MDSDLSVQSLNCIFTSALFCVSESLLFFLPLAFFPPGCLSRRCSRCQGPAFDTRSLSSPNSRRWRRGQTAIAVGVPSEPLAGWQRRLRAPHGVGNGATPFPRHSRNQISGCPFSSRNPVRIAPEISSGGDRPPTGQKPPAHIKEAKTQNCSRKPRSPQPS